MRIRVLFFGLAHDVTGFGQEEAEISEGSDVAGLCQQYRSRFPRWAEISTSLLVSVNQNISSLARTLEDGDEVAFLPPVSGGSGGDFYRITREVIITGRLAGEIKAPEDGALVIFEGVVRNHSQGRRTLYLEYEAYEPMAVRLMREIGEEARQKFPIDRLGMIHRVGRLEIGETSVAIFVSSAHRRAAFDACHYAVDEVKRRVPIWKKEYFEGGAAWVEGEAREPAAVDA